MNTLMTRVRDRRDDSGYTLMELMVALGVFTVVLVVVMAGIISMTTTMRKTSNQTDASDQIRRAILRMDKTVPYSDAITVPGQVGSDWYVEFDTTAGGAHTCAQWRLVAATDLLQYRSWTVTSGTITAPSWQTVATGIVNNPTTQQPFQLQTYAQDNTLVKQELLVKLYATKGTQSVGRAQATTLFVARNSTVNSDPDVCNQVARG
jgi:prepilin-type N-terminal cleavage/methylation domain-containing protein